jgi:large subunit ribosomal protein L4
VSEEIMKLKVIDINNKPQGEIELDDATFNDIFARPVRKDILARVVNWQLAKRRSGNHKTKEIGDISGTTKKPYAQKGTGRARQGSLRSPQFRGGATIFGPVVRSHEHDLPKKFRALGLKTALSSKVKEGKLIVLDGVGTDAKTKDVVKKFEALGWKSVLLIEGPEVTEGFARAARNIPNVDVLPQQGANVYDILRRDTLVLTKDAVQHLVERLK